MEAAEVASDNGHEARSGKSSGRILVAPSVWRANPERAIRAFNFNALSEQHCG
jgi:hypothetical protein